MCDFPVLVLPSREDRDALAASVACVRYQSSTFHCQQATFTV